MKFSKLAKTLQLLEDTSSRLEITTILSELINKLDTKESANGIYLSLGYLKAEYNSEKFNIADKMMIKILTNAFDKSEDEIKKVYADKGDLGSVGKEISKKGNSRFDLDINTVHKKLLEVAQVKGTGSQQKKIDLTSDLLKQADSLSIKFLIRIILGTVRLGFTELTVIGALSQYLNDEKKVDKKKAKIIESKYRIHPDIGKITQKIKEGGIGGLDQIKIEVGVPIHAQKAQRLNNPKEIVEKMGEVWIEQKFDGTRVQLHMDRNKKMEVKSFKQQDFFGIEKKMIFIKTYTRNLEETTHQFPDLISAADKQIEADSIILDGEAVGYNKKTGEFLPFQQTIQRKRKYDIKKTAKQIPLKYMVFDILYLDGKSLVNEPLLQRREILKRVIKKGKTINVDDHIKTENIGDIKKYSEEALKNNFEGIMAKKIDSTYKAGARNFTWVKLKKSQSQILNDSIDCVVLGYYHGRGDRAKFGIGGFLAGIWDKKDNKFKTITKVGSGLTDEGWEGLKKRCDKISTLNKPKNVDANKKYNCDVWVDPKIVVEIASDELSKSTDHSAKYALRFPRMLKYRPDKSPTDTTSLSEIKQMHKNQTQL